MSVITQIKYLILFVFLVCFHLVKAQKTPYLERLVTLNESKKTIAELFKIISAQTSVVFSYSQSFNDKQELTLICRKQPLRMVMTELLKGTSCSYKLKDKYIILTCNDKSASPPTKIRGYVYDATDSSVISQASIYIKQFKLSGISNNYGFFDIPVSKTFPTLSVSVAKENYYDTTLVVYNPLKKEVSVYLYPKENYQQTFLLPRIITEPKDTAIVMNNAIAYPAMHPVDFWQKFKAFNTNFRNISDTLFSNFSLSFVPYIGTNHLLSINTINKYSLNILAGYSKGIDVFELGGLFNIDNGNVKYAQVAGLGNIVSGNFMGVQVAGLFNLNSRTTSGVQIGGVFNYNHMQTEGVTIGGICNISKSVTRGVQLAGTLNLSKRTDGLQLSGIMNQSDTVYGVQLSAILNKASYLNGIQLSLLNVADTASGVPIGLFSYVKKGYHKVEIGFDELSFATLSFGSGVSKLHNVFISGINCRNPQLWTYGYGLGSTFHLYRKWNLVLGLMAQQIQGTHSQNITGNMLSKLIIGSEYQMRPKLCLGIAPTWSVFYADVTDINYYSLYKDLVPYHFYGQSTSDKNLKMWVGAKLYLKLF